MTDFDPEIFTNNPDVMVGDGGLIFKTGNSGVEFLGKGDGIRVGDLIVLNHSSDGDLVTHGKSRIGVGDRVILVKGKDGDIYALKAGRGNPYRDCPLIHHVTHDKSVFHEDGRCFYHRYDMHLERPISRLSGGGWPTINLRMDFNVQYWYPDPVYWYPYGGVWLAVSEDGNNWFWCAGTDSPYLTIAGAPMWEGNNGKSQFCVTDWLGACTSCCPPPGSINNINYLQVHIHHINSMVWRGSTKTRLLYLTLCEGGVREGWCDSLDDLGIRPYL